MEKHDKPNRKLPIKRKLQLTYIISFLIAILMAAAAIIGLLYRDQTYPTDELILAFLPNDVVNIAIGLPILLVSMWLTSRGKLIGLLFWPGALFYVLYNYLIYLLAMPFGLALLLHLILVAASIYALIDLIANIDGKAVQQQLTGVVPERLAGGVLAGLGLLFLIRVIGVFTGAIISKTPIPEAEVALNVSDFLTSPATIVGGFLLWRRKALGYVSGLGLLFQLSMLFIGLIAVLLMHPFIVGTPLAVVDIVVVFIMGLICFIPFTLFVRGVVSSASK